MPLYEYECTSCRHRFERLQKFSDPPVRRCVRCRGRVEKVLSAPGIQFKGSGWYVTDYARKGRSAEKERDKGEKAPAKEGKATAAAKSGRGPGGKRGDK
ncbi:MAG: FmdB family zinc ribbon protein [Acidobacteriota bacterium]